jgi:hypothetical protein
MKVAGERSQMAAIGFEVFGGHDDELAGESVAEGVERGTLLAVGGAGSGGELRVGEVCFD